MSVKLDAVSNGKLIHRYLAEVFFTKYEEKFSFRWSDHKREKFQRVLYTRHFFQIQWQNVWMDVKASFALPVVQLATTLGVLLLASKHPMLAFIGAVSYDNATRGSVTPAAASLSYSHTNSSSSGRAMYFGSVAITASTWTAATYNSVSTTKNSMNEGSSCRAQTYYLGGDGNCATGSNTATFTPGSNQVIIGLVVSFTGSNGTLSDFQDAYNGSSHTTSSISIPNFSSGDMAVDIILIPADDPTFTSVGANQTTRLSFHQDPTGDPSACVTGASTNSTDGSMTWTWVTARAETLSGMRVQKVSSARTHMLGSTGAGT